MCLCCASAVVATANEKITANKIVEVLSN